MRRIITWCWLLLLCAAAGMLFWYNEWKFNLPTPVPADYASVTLGTTIPLQGIAGATATKPVFLHFFNPDCPCSKFNMDHVRSLIRQYGSRADFKLVLVTDKKYTAAAVQHRFNIDIPVLYDTTLARSCGVYSTPQAVILDNQHRLYYRGNYNRSRYCTDKKTNYAQSALETLLQHSYTTLFEPAAVKAYGCQLPGCKQ